MAPGTPEVPAKGFTVLCKAKRDSVASAQARETAHGVHNAAVYGVDHLCEHCEAGADALSLSGDCICSAAVNSIYRQKYVWRVTGFLKAPSDPSFVSLLCPLQSHAETNGNSVASLGPASSYMLDTLLAVNPSSIGKP